MKPLLKPARHPHPDMLCNMLGFCGRSLPCDPAKYQTAITRILAELCSLSSSERYGIEQSLDRQDASLTTYFLERQGASIGLVTLAYGNKRGYSLTGKLLWSCLPLIDAVVESMDSLWNIGQWSVLYAYDQDDYSLQNTTAVPGMQHWGLDREQLHFVTRFGVVEEIDPRGNPGYMLDHDGLLWSVQWLNYWSKQAQEQMLTAPLARLPEGVERQELGASAVRIRLGEKPGRLDDVAFHELQLECRHSLPFRPPFGSR